MWLQVSLVRVLIYVNMDQSNQFVVFCLQPPKKKGGKKGKAKKKSAKTKTPTIIDGVSTEEMTKEQVWIFHLIWIIM